MKIPSWASPFTSKMVKNLWQPSSLARNDGTHLPESFHAAHHLCMVVHDVMVELLASGEASRIFTVRFNLQSEADRELLNSLGDVFAWMENTGRESGRVEVLINAVFPAVLSDMLHCIYESLENSRKGKLNITFMLLRKAVQESLFLFEAIAVDRAAFANTLATEPGRLHSQTAGGPEVHTRRIRSVLEQLGEDVRFDASYIAQLRYDKSAEDGFDGICNLAMHLFTTHRAIRTEPMNVNFVFSNYESKLTQWEFLYSRLPYLLIYTRSLIEFICSTIRTTHPAYIEDIDRRVLAYIALWWTSISESYRCHQLEVFATASREHLDKSCLQAGFREPNRADLIRMAETGAFPGETARRVKARQKGFLRTPPDHE